jgi:hypothetical protein
MFLNRWLILGLFVFLLIETLGFSFPNGGGYVCPTCNGAGKIFVRGVWELGIPDSWETCPTCGGTGWIWTPSLQNTVAVVCLFSLFLFLGLFLLMYASSGFYAAMNPYVNHVESMDWFFNPMYLTWLFVKNRRKWSLYATIMSTPYAIMLGIAFYALNVSKIIDSVDLRLGSIADIGFITIAALCWYEGVCKPFMRSQEAMKAHNEKMNGSHKAVHGERKD